MTPAETPLGRIGRLLRSPDHVARVALRRSRAALGSWRRAQAQHRFESGARRLLEGVARDEAARDVVALCDSGFARTRGVHALCGRELARAGALPLWLLAGGPAGSLADPALRRVEGALVRRSSCRYDRAEGPPRRLHAWELDLPGGVARAEGVEFHPAILNALRRQFRRYRIDFRDAAVAAAAQELLPSVDAALGQCLALEELAQRGRRVTVTSAELNYVPGGVYNLFVRQRGARSGMRFVDLGPAYSHYFQVGAGAATEYALLDLTRHDADSRLDVPAVHFEAWLAGRPDGATALVDARRVAGQNRTATRARAPEAEALLRRVRDWRASGRPVVVLYGHLAFDLGGLHDRGLAHADMADWLNDTLDALSGGDALVLVKPHVAEGRYKANRRPLELLRDLRAARAEADNVVWLDPLWFNAFELFDHVDAGLVWRSSVALEMALFDRPALVCGTETYYRRAMGLPEPRDRDDYHARLRQLGAWAAPGPLAERAALLLRYIPERTFVPLPQLAPEGGATGPMAWQRAAVEAFLASGDPGVARLAAGLRGADA
ncbi:MAG: hypothetical protein KJ067_04200 [Vicinamibacteria bacterium]|nr:hypothetical protein [Vicinamibacteria bacterium]